MLIIKAPMQRVDMQTGAVIEEGTVDWHLLPVDTSQGQCSECGHKHEVASPHNLTMYYRYSFYAKNNRWPTWADAIAHCEANLRELWKQELIARGVWDAGEDVA
jgi:hypothetical protein